MTHLLEDNDFQLNWFIDDAFGPWQKLETSFCVLLPEPYRFEAELSALDWTVSSRKFLCTIKYDNDFDPEAPTAESVEVMIIQNDVPVIQNLVYDYPFTADTRHLYSFEVEIQDPGYHIDIYLQILGFVKIKQLGIDAARTRRNDILMGLLFGGSDIDMKSLSLALKGSQMNNIYSTMSMFSKENREIFVHHCILQVRWANLFTIHNLNENSASLNTNISFLVLYSIIQYMYSGKVNAELVIWDMPLLATELFQVIWRYQIFHLYDALRQTDLSISQYATNYVERRRISFALRYQRVVNLKEKIMAYPVYVYPYPINRPGPDVHTFLFYIHIRNVNQAGPWLSYSLWSQSDIPFNVHVTLDVPGNRGILGIIHSGDYRIPENGRVESEPLLFLGSPPIFFRHGSHRVGNEIYKKLFFGLTFSDGTSTVSIYQLSDPEMVRRKPREILYQHMREVLKRQFKTDLAVRPDGGTAQPHRIHKAIFEARLPGWRNVVEPNLPEGAALPDAVTLSLSNESYHYIVPYMYTGTMLKVPSTFQQEIFNFAFDSNFLSLQRVIYSMN